MKFCLSISICYVCLNAKYYCYVISDLRMPAMNGMKLLKVIKNVNCSIRTTLLTTFDLDETNRKSHHSLLIMVKIRSGSVEPITLELRFRNPTLFIYCIILDSLIGLWRSSPISLCIFNKLNPFSVVL